MKFSRLQISTVLAISVLLWILALKVQDTDITADHLSPFFAVVSALVIISLLVEYYFWRLKILQKWFVSMPDIRGTWKVDIKSDWVNPEAGETIAPIKCYMGVKQSLSSLQMHLMTPESESWLTAYSIKDSRSGNGYQISAVYTNKPSVHLRNNRSSMHLGALILDTHGEDEIHPDSLIGEYWTDRKTTGLITLTNRDDKKLTSFLDAENYFKG